MKHLVHSGIMVPRYEPKGFSIAFKGKKTLLTPQQEEMAIAWVRKLGTEYAEDKTFIKNFFGDFCKALSIGKASPEDFDFTEIKNFVEKERERKLNMPKEEKKKLAAERKAMREANKEKYGYAEIDGEKVELGNYLAEPSSIFMGRGKHPLRGKWKQGPNESDVVLNLSPDAKVPPGKWKEIVFNPGYLWIARWDDKLTGKEKYIWLSDTSPIKQEREIEKLNKAKELEKKFEDVKEFIIKNIDSEDLKKRKVATVCYLIDALSMRVGDEKDEDEADTCIPLGEFILGEENKPIQSFKTGDLILDGNGNFVPILKLFSRPYVGQIIKIHGCGLFPFALTGNHPVLVTQRIGTKGDTFNFTEVRFKPAKELDADLDYLVFPKLKTNIQNYEVNLKHYPMLIKRPGPQKILLDKKLAEFFGIYLAEGCATIEHCGKNRHEGRIVLTFGLKEIDLAKRTSSIANNLFHRRVRVLKEQSCIRVIFFSLQLARFLQQNFGKRAHLKTIPSFIMKAPNHIIKVFVKAYFTGDACLRREKPHDKYVYQRFVLTTSSRAVAIQLQKLLSKIGIFSPISLKAGKATKILGRKVRTHQAYHVTVGGKAMEKLDFVCSSKRFRPRYYDAKGCFYIPIKKIEKIQYKGGVFNFQTTTGLFEVSNITVHNCGATTLGKDNIIIGSDNKVKFDFLGKDSVRWEKEIVLPEQVVRNLKEFVTNSKSFVFEEVRSEDVNAFYNEALEGLTAKVFRTYHASKAVKDFLENTKAKKDDPESYKKYVATMANLQAAIICNHKRKLPKTWDKTLAKKKERLQQLKLKKGKKTKEKIKELKLKIELMKQTKDYNLNTSLKSYVDPRIFFNWSNKVGFDWKKYYSKTLQKKFSWVENEKKGD